MSSGRPASLDSSLLARKGAAAPAILPDSPLTEELGEPRPEPVPLSFGAADAMAAPSSRMGDPDARRRFLSALFLVIFAAALFFAASRVLPTAATVSSAPSTLLKSMGEIADTKERAVTASAAKTGGPAAADGTVMRTPMAEMPAAASPDRAAVATDLEKAKKAPLVALIPQSAKPKRAKPPRAVRSGRYLLQLASLRSAGDARREVSRLQNRLRPVLGKRKIVVVRALPKGKRPVYRLRASAYRSRNSARAACDRIKKLKIGCLVIRR